MADRTKVEISKKALHFLKKLEVEEAGKRNVVGVEHDSFVFFLCALYMQVRGDDRVLALARSRAERYEKGEENEVQTML